MSDTTRVPNAGRYSMAAIMDTTYLRCNECYEKKKSNSSTGIGWIYAFESRGLPDILNAVTRHEVESH